MNRYDLLIIGAGPAGLSTAIEAQCAGLRALVLDKGSIVDSIQKFQRDMFFFSTPELLEIGNIPFVVPTTRPTTLDCVNYYRRVADHFQIPCKLYEEVLSINRCDLLFAVTTSTGTTYETKAVVVATGYYDMPNPLGVPGEQLSHVTHFYRDPLPYYRQQVVIVGGKNSAVEAALDLYRHGANVTVIHRGSTLSSGVKYWILPDFENRVKDGSITLLLNSTVREFKPHQTTVSVGGNFTKELLTDFAFILIGYRTNVPFLKSLGIEIDPDTLAPNYHPETMETNVPGIFVAGGMVGGRFNNKVFIENGREHGKKIVRSLTSR